jgi:hypothetical protein
VTEPLLGHLDDSERPCERHPIDLEALLLLAAIGTRTQSFNHDVASKIQGLMMAVDEIAELSSTPDLKQAAETAHTALADLNQLLQQNRALTKPPVIARTPLHDLISKAATRVGVTLRGAKVTGEVEVAVPLMTQALAIAFDVASGAERRRTLELGVNTAAGSIELTVPFAATAAAAGEQLAIAAWIVARDRGQLHCTTSSLIIRLPLAA